MRDLVGLDEKSAPLAGPDRTLRRDWRQLINRVGSRDQRA